MFLLSLLLVTFQFLLLVMSKVEYKDIEAKFVFCGYVPKGKTDAASSNDNSDLSQHGRF